MMELQQAEDIAVKAIQMVLCLAPESTTQLSQYISPSIQARLESTNTSNPSSGSLGSLDNAIAEGPGTDRMLVPFARGRKEARKPSYKIH